MPPPGPAATPRRSVSCLASRPRGLRSARRPFTLAALVTAASGAPAHLPPTVWARCRSAGSCLSPGLGRQAGVVRSGRGRDRLPRLIFTLRAHPDIPLSALGQNRCRIARTQGPARRARPMEPHGARLKVPGWLGMGARALRPFTPCDCDDVGPRLVLGRRLRRRLEPRCE